MAETISTFATRVVSGVIAGAIRSWLSGGPTGSSRVRLSGFPLAIDVFVGDIVRVDFESRFEFVNESWQAVFFDGQQVFWRTFPESGWFDESMEKVVTGELWFAAQRFFCDDEQGSNEHTITVLGMVSYYPGPYHAWELKRPPQFMLTQPGLPPSRPLDFQRTAGQGEWGLWFTRAPTYVPLVVDKRDIPLRIHNPYFVEAEGVGARRAREHHSEGDVRIRLEPWVDYSLSSGGLTLNRPHKAIVETVVDGVREQSWDVRVPPRVELLLPQDHKELVISATHRDPHHPNVVDALPLTTGIKASGTNHIFRGSALVTNEEEFAWWTWFVNRPLGRTRFSSSDHVECADAHEGWFEHRFGYLHDLFELDAAAGSPRLHVHFHVQGGVTVVDERSGFRVVDDAAVAEGVDIPVAAVTTQPPVFEAGFTRPVKLAHAQRFLRGEKGTEVLIEGIADETEVAQTQWSRFRVTLLVAAGSGGALAIGPPERTLVLRLGQPAHVDPHMSRDALAAKDLHALPGIQPRTVSVLRDLGAVDLDAFAALDLRTVRVGGVSPRRMEGWQLLASVAAAHPSLTREDLRFLAALDAADSAHLGRILAGIDTAAINAAIREAGLPPDYSATRAAGLIGSLARSLIVQ
jgi:hypothetical protein